MISQKNLFRSFQFFFSLKLFSKEKLRFKKQRIDFSTHLSLTELNGKTLRNNFLTKLFHTDKISQKRVQTNLLYLIQDKF